MPDQLSDQRVCTCLATVRDLEPCPAHGVFPMASARLAFEQGQGDRMDVIERWVIYACQVCGQTYETETDCDDGHYREAVQEVEVVRLAAYQGAVDALRELANAAAHCVPVNSTAERHERLRAAIAAASAITPGQSVEP